jgi:hypothetical protein
MPELHWHYGYHAALGTIVLIGGVLAVCFWRRDWLERVTGPPGPSGCHTAGLTSELGEKAYQVDLNHRNVAAE